MTEIKGKVLITGGTGSFGQTVLRHLVEQVSVDEIRVFSRDEKKQDDLRRELASDKVKFIIGDVRDKDSVQKAISGVDIVFHAAALKQVPSCEFFPLQAVKTNIIGASNVLESARRSGVSRVVVLSTDKAVYPINAMGMTKALMEKTMIASAREGIGGTVYSGTRYGNVMASRGSVIPLFINQIKNGQAITVTDPNMTRFMMTLDEAVGLVYYAMTEAKSGDIVVQKSPAATIATLADALKKIYSSSVPVRTVGVRHGEKVYETLVGAEEMSKAVDKGQYYVIPMDSRDLNYAQYFEEGRGVNSIEGEYNSHNTVRLDVDATIELLLKLPIISRDV